MSPRTVEGGLGWHKGARKLYSTQTRNDTERQEQAAKDASFWDSPHTRQDQCQETFDSQLLCFGGHLHGLQPSCVSRCKEAFYCVYANVLRGQFSKLTLQLLKVSF